MVARCATTLWPSGLTTRITGKGGCGVGRSSAENSSSAEFSAFVSKMLESNR